MDNINNFLALYKKFHQDCGHVADIPACRRKLYEECLEYAAAFESSVDADIDGETTDVLNTSLYLKSLTHPNPLFAGYLKLEATKIKYQKQKETE